MRLSFLVFLGALLLAPVDAASSAASFHVLAFYEDQGEPDHIMFARQAIAFFTETAARDHFSFAATTHWDDCNLARLRQFQLVLWLNDFPKNAAQRAAFEDYMEHGGAWLGFHVSAYNDQDTHWPWFVRFLGGAIFFGNSWPPLPAKLVINDHAHPVVTRLGATLSSPDNEWYIWKPSPRLSKDVKVLLTLDPSNYPIGLKDTIVSGDLPVVWTNTRYHMLYMNMGHGDKIFTSKDQNQLFEDAVVWLGRRAASQSTP
jgi:type 1 glutamine amidotransferase